MTFSLEDKAWLVVFNVEMKTKSNYLILGLLGLCCLSTILHHVQPF